MVLLQANAFVDNAFETREDVQRALIALLDPLAAHTSPGGALIDIGSSAAHYDTRAVELEAFARPLWGLASLLAGGEKYKGAQRWIDGFKNGTDPKSPEYWQASKAKDQRMVEMSPLSFALVLAPEVFYDTQSQETKENIAAFLGSCQSQPMPDTNWLWFRVFSNLALRAIKSPLFNPERMELDLQRLDSFQLSPHPPAGTDEASAGWSRDGPEDVKQLDYYSSSFAIQVAQMFYSKVCASTDPARAKSYRDRAQSFILDFVHYFSPSGAAIPFGRSIIYRFAMVATFSALALADIPPPAPLTWGHIKGIVLRHLRTWRTPAIFRSDGTLNIGYAYDNMYASENYNAPGSPYWCCKAFLCLAAGADHPFWTSEELPLPELAMKALPDPGHIMCHTGGHTFLLSSGQTAHYAMRNGNAKYGKFAYSSHFGFCYSTGVLDLEQVAADSMLAVRSEDVEDAWRVRRGGEDAKIVARGTSDVHLVSTWKPYPDVEIKTWLFPPREGSYFYTRVHKITSGRKFESAEAGWATYGQAADGRALVQAFSGETSEGGEVGPGAARATTKAGSVGVVDLNGGRQGVLVQSDPNSNAIFARSVLPTLKGTIEPGETWYSTAVFGMPFSDGVDQVKADAAWNASPVDMATVLKKL